MKTRKMSLIAGAVFMLSLVGLVCAAPRAEAFTYSMEIDGGASETSDSYVRLDFATDDGTVDRMIVYGDIVGGSFYLPYGASSVVTLTDGAGEKTVYVDFYSREEPLLRATRSATITYAPSGPGYTYNLEIDGGASVTIDQEVHLTMSTDDLDVIAGGTMLISGDIVGAGIVVPYATGQDVILTDGAGTKTVTVTFIDSGGGTVYTCSDSISYSPSETGYSYSLLINGGTTITHDRNASLGIGTTDPDVITGGTMLISGDIVGAGIEVPYAASHDVLLTDGVGDKAVRVTFIKADGTTVANCDASILYSPSEHSYEYYMTINGGAAVTTDVNAHLAINTTDPSITTLHISGDIVGSFDMPYATGCDVALTGGSGVKAVNVAFINGEGTTVRVRFGTIIYLVPIGPSHSYFLAINGGAAVTDSVGVRLNIGTTDPTVDEMIIRGDFVGGPIRAPYATGYDVALTSGNGAKTVYVDFLSGGSVVGFGSDSILLDVSGPVIPHEVSFTIQGPAASSPGYTNTADVTLLIDSPDAAQMMISNDPGFTGAGWETFAATRAWVLTAGDGLKTVYLKTKDPDGVASDTAMAGIFLDTVAPVASDYPTVNGTVLRSGDYLSSSSFQLRQPASDPVPASNIDPAAVKVMIGGTAYAAAYRAGVISLDFRGALTTGTYDVSVVAKDFAGNEAALTTVTGVIVRDDFTLDESDSGGPLVFPNPVTGAAKISFTLTQDASDVRIRIFDLNGFQRKVIEAGPRSAGYNEVEFDADGLVNDSYLVLVTAQTAGGATAVGRTKFSVYR